MGGKGGKKKGPVWAHYEDFFVEKKLVHRCKYCSEVFQANNATKKSAHLISCSRSPPEVKKEFTALLADKDKKKIRDNNRSSSEEFPNGWDNPSSSNSQDDIVDIEMDETQSKQGKKRQKVMDDYAYSMDKMTQSEQKKACEKFVMALLVTGCSFMVFQHDLWKDFFNFIRPGFQIPTRQTIGTTLLDKEYKKTMEDIWFQINKAENLNLQLDGWSNCRKQGIINFLVTLPKVLLFKILDTETYRHFAEYICEKIVEVIQEIGPQKVFCLMGDNAGNMQKSFRLVKKIFKHIVPLGCLAHALHLLFETFVKNTFIKVILADANYVIYSVTNSSILSSNLTAIQKKLKVTEHALLKPGKTRWGSQLFSLESLIRNKNALYLLVNEQSIEDVLAKKENDRLREIVLNDNFWRNVSDCIECMKPITDTITAIEGDDFGIQKVHNKMKEMVIAVVRGLLKSTFPISEKKALFRAVKARLKKSLKPIHLSAVIFDPMDKGSVLNAYEDAAALRFISETASNMENVSKEKVMEQLINYRNAKDLWNEKHLCWVTSSKFKAHDWWKCFFGKTDLGKVACRILSAPVTSAAAERSFSTFSFVHALRRNKLSAEKAGKITLVAHNYKLMNRKEKAKKEKKQKSDAELAADKALDEQITELGEIIFDEGDDSDVDETNEEGTETEIAKEYEGEYEEEFDDDEERFLYLDSWFEEDELADLEAEDLLENDEEEESWKMLENVEEEIPMKQIVVKYKVPPLPGAVVPDEVLGTIGKWLEKNPNKRPKLIKVEGIDYTLQYD